jgi:hypothetical protein
MGERLRCTKKTPRVATNDIQEALERAGRL